MRVIAGKFKGHNLISFQGEHIRPTTDRVKETLFNIISADVEGSQVLDLFAGTGNLGIESLSRDCKNVIFVEKHPKSIQIVKDNLVKLKIKSDYQIVQKEVFAFLKSYKGEPFDIIFADPPFTEKMGHLVVQAIDRSQAIGENTILAIESLKQERMDEEYDKLYRSDKRVFGDKILSFYKMKESL